MSSGNSPTLTCVVNIHWCNKNKEVIRKVAEKDANLRMTRNGLREMFLEITGKKLGANLFQLKNFVVHKKFMTEGKTSIDFKEDQACVMLSNAPASQLILFLKTMYVKLSEDKARTPIPRHLTDTRGSLDDISPMTTKELLRSKENLAAKGEITLTPKSSKDRPKVTKRPLSSVATDMHPKKNIKKRCLPVSMRAVLTTEQDYVLQTVLSGRNIFFTGSAGTGKSFLLKTIINALPPESTFATASTGVAACHIGGYTLHSFAGIGLGTGSEEHCVKLARRPHAAQVWKSCKVLIVDEISMVEAKFFEMLEYVARQVRASDKPFGGIQLVLCGDFLQLPPVGRSEGGSQGSARFCFQSKAWDRCKLYTYELPKIHRQTDAEFIDILQNIRVGRVTDEIAERLNETRNQVIETEGIQASRLCSLTKESEAINYQELNALKTPAVVFEAVDSDMTLGTTLDNMTPVAKNLTLKVGAQVMLMKNLNIAAGLVNGARGVITKFNDRGNPVVRFLSTEHEIKREKWPVRLMGGSVVTRRQIPLKLAWAISIHKSQGLTLDCVEVSLGKIFEAGQAYVALSRAKSLSTIKVLDFDSKLVWANPEVLKFYRKLKQTMSVMEHIPLGPVKKKQSLLFERSRTM